MFDMKNFSKYNYLFRSRGKYYIFNSISRFFAELDEDAFKKLKSIEENMSLENILDLPKELLDSDVFMDEEQERNELYKIKLHTYKKRFENRYSTFVIAPTYHCNFNCVYCYESSRPAVYMDEETENNIVTFVENMNLKSFHITWFGGEPLLNFKRIESMTRRILKLGLHYNSDIITNGYLLDESRVSKFEELHINSIQLTIDGLKEYHDKRRPHMSGISSFDRIMKNLDNFFSKERNVLINIRINIDKTNRQNFYALYDFLKEKYPKINIYPAFVFVKDKNSIAYSNCMASGMEKLDFNMEVAKKLKQPFKIYPGNRPEECIARSYNSFVIGADGSMFKCFDSIGDKDKCVGNINTGELNLDEYAKWIMGADPLTDKKCVECKLLPICHGHCPMLRLENEKAGKEVYNTCHLMKNIEEKILTLHLREKGILSEL